MELVQNAERQLKALVEVKECFSLGHQEKEKEVETGVAAVLLQVKEARERLSKPSTHELAKILYVEGKALDCATEEYSKDAEALLSKATKLDPQNIDCWNSLGECLWKKKDVVAAIDCFAGSLQQSPNKEALRLMSVLLRKAPCGSKEEKVSKMHESFQKAKEAVALDLDDAKSWYFLGNAYLSRYFSLSHDVEDLTCALKTYEKSEKLGQRSNAPENPDLFFNRAEVYCYLEDYQKAKADWEKSASLDPSLNSQEKLDHLSRRMRRVWESVEKRGKIKAKRLCTVAATLRQDHTLPEELKKKKEVVMDSLKEGINEGVFLKVKVLKQVRPTDDTPASFLVVDKEEKVFILSVYNVESSYLAKLRAERDLLHLFNPRCKRIQWDSQQLRVVQTTSPLNLYVNSSSLDVLSFSHAAITTTSF